MELQQTFTVMTNQASLFNRSVTLGPTSGGQPISHIQSVTPILRPKEIDPSYIEPWSYVDSGSFGNVNIGYLSSVPQVVAIKTPKDGYNKTQEQDFLAEALIMGQLNHPNIISLVGVVTRKAPIMIVMEYMDRGSLYRFLQGCRSSGISLKLSQGTTMLLNIVSAMMYITGMGFVHRDLAARNVLVAFRNQQIVCKVSDFGLTRKVNAVSNDYTPIYLAQKKMFSAPWTAPEANQFNEFSSLSDVWSFGVVMWEVLTYGEQPYEDMTDNEIFEFVRLGHRLPFQIYWSPVLCTMMQNCWDLCRKRRLTFNQIDVELQTFLASLLRQDIQSTISCQIM